MKHWIFPRGFFLFLVSLFKNTLSLFAPRPQIHWLVVMFSSALKQGKFSLLWGNFLTGHTHNTHAHWAWQQQQYRHQLLLKFLFSLAHQPRDDLRWGPEPRSAWRNGRTPDLLPSGPVSWPRPWLEWSPRPLVGAGLWPGSRWSRRKSGRRWSTGSRWQCRTTNSHSTWRQRQINFITAFSISDQFLKKKVC